MVPPAQESSTAHKTLKGLLPLPPVQDFEAVVFVSVMAYAGVKAPITDTLSKICLSTVTCLSSI